jgi:hypothetical protein
MRSGPEVRRRGLRSGQRPARALLGPIGAKQSKLGLNYPAKNLTLETATTPSEVTICIISRPLAINAQRLSRRRQNARQADFQIRRLGLLSRHPCERRQDLHRAHRLATR